MMKVANCVICGVEFVKTRNKKSCGPECQQLMNKEYFRSRKAASVRPRLTHEIPAFPADIDRDAFGHWLSGFADGEATFGLRVTGEDAGNPQAIAYFRISTRDDDVESLKQIRAFWGCGRLYFADNARSKIANAKPVAIYAVQSVADLVGVVVPHFGRYPMRAKKRNDFLVWREGVRLMAEVQGRPLEYRPGRAPNRHGGTFPKWKEAERERFASLSEQLRQQRLYAPADRTPARYS